MAWKIVSITMVLAWIVSSHGFAAGESNALMECSPINKIGQQAQNRLFQSMRSTGGYFILIRHAWRGKVKRVKPDHGSKNCNESYDNLTTDGRDQARQVGLGLYLDGNASISVAKTFASPACRTTDTARIILNQFPNPKNFNVNEKGELKSSTRQLEVFLYGVKIPPNGNVLVVSHSTYINGFIGQLIGEKPKNVKFACAEAAVLMPIQADDKTTAFKCMARILPEEWKKPGVAVPEWLKKNKGKRCAPDSAVELRE